MLTLTLCACFAAPLRFDPPAVLLAGRLDARQVLVSSGALDLTADADYRIEPADLARVEGGFVRPLRDGTGRLLVKAGGQEAAAVLQVTGFATTAPVSFRNDVIASLNVGGCNQGACHGTPSGKNGFKLSLRGNDPAADFIQLTRDVTGRRTDKLTPGASLMLLKALGRVPHEGGARWPSGGVAAELVHTWLAEGLRDDAPKLPGVAQLDIVAPAGKLLQAPHAKRQLAVRATFTGATTARDVTRLCNFSSSDSTIADVNANGLVEFKQAGEVAILVRYLEELRSIRLTYLESNPKFVWPNPPERNGIDRAVFAKLKQMSIAPSALCGDGDFVRRVTLDLSGRLPTPEETRTFLDDKATDKRAKLIDRLLETPDYADFWTLKWSDVLRSSRKTIQAKGAFGFQRWLNEQIKVNTPIDRVVRELLTATGSGYANPPANYYRIARDPTTLAETTAQLFLGARMQCAKCHNHPFERWTQDDYYGLAAFFARVKTKKDDGYPGAKAGDASSEVIFVTRGGEVTQPRTGQTLPPRYPGGTAATLAPGQDRRQALADWLTKADNPFFARAVANRVWFHLLGKGVVDPVDDFRESNPPSNDELLDVLAKELTAGGYDVKKLIRVIANSHTYQLAAEPSATNANDTKYFSRAVTKLLSAEQLLDALCDVTGVPEKYAGLPAGTRAVQLPDGEVNHPFLKAFGQPARELACECERESDSNLGQALQLINGPTINDKLRRPDNRLGLALGAKTPPAKLVDELYLRALSRPPLAGETKDALDYVGKATDKRKAWEDVVWAVLNTREFLFRH